MGWQESGRGLVTAVEQGQQHGHGGGGAEPGSREVDERERDLLLLGEVAGADRDNRHVAGHGAAAAAERGEQNRQHGLVLDDNKRGPRYPGEPIRYLGVPAEICRLPDNT